MMLLWNRSYKEDDVWVMVNIRPNDPISRPQLPTNGAQRGAVNVWFEKKIVFRHRNLIDGALENRSDAILSLCNFRHRLLPR